MERMFASDGVVLDGIAYKRLERQSRQQPLVVSLIDIHIEEEFIGITHLEELAVGTCKLHLVLELRFSILTILDNVAEGV